MLASLLKPNAFLHLSPNMPDFIKLNPLDPYQGIQVSIPVRNIYQLPTAPQYLFDEEARRSRRNLSDNLNFFTGCGYLLGALGGGASGLIAGVKSFKPSDTAKLRANWVLQPSDLEATAKNILERMQAKGFTDMSRYVKPSVELIVVTPATEVVQDVEVHFEAEGHNSNATIYEDFNENLNSKTVGGFNMAGSNAAVYEDCENLDSNTVGGFNMVGGNVAEIVQDVEVYFEVRGQNSNATVYQNFNENLNSYTVGGFNFFQYLNTSL
nr:mitochondrial import inner membrane translocase subunit tim23-1 [Quercus suber]